jgi:hypothetical protein
MNLAAETKVDPWIAAEVRRRGKDCTHCHRWQPAEAFPPTKRLKSGLDSWCKSCRHEAVREWRSRNREALKARRRRGPLQVVCVDCGGEFAAARRDQVRCERCQVEYRRRRKR